MTNDTIDVGHSAAGAAHDVVMVVAYPRLVPGSTPRWLDASHQTGAGERVECVIYGLQCQVPNPFPCHPGNFVGTRMVPRTDRGQDRQPR